MTEQGPMQPYLSLKFTIRALLGALFAAAFSAFFLDQILSRFFQNDLEPYMTVRKIARELTDLGYGTKYFIIAVGMMLTGMGIDRLLSQKNPHTKTIFDWGAKLLLSLIASGLVIHLGKFLIGRARPHMTVDFNPFVFQPLTTNPHFHSMPSGHSQTIFVLVGVLFLFLRTIEKTRYQSLVLTVGLILMFTRVITHQHFMSDCILGATIGYLLTYKVCEMYDNKFGRK